MTPQDLTIRINARALLAKPESHTKGAFARIPNGYSSAISNPVACQFCALGAAKRAAVDLGFDTADANAAVWALYEALPTDVWSVPEFNDAPATTHADILALYDRAIAKESQA